MNYTTCWLVTGHLIRVNVAELLARGLTNAITVGQKIMGIQNVGQENERNVDNIRQKAWGLWKNK